MAHAAVSRKEQLARRVRLVVYSGPRDRTPSLQSRHVACDRRSKESAKPNRYHAVWQSILPFKRTRTTRFECYSILHRTHCAQCAGNWFTKWTEVTRQRSQASDLWERQNVRIKAIELTSLTFHKGNKLSSEFRPCDLLPFSVACALLATRELAECAVVRGRTPATVERQFTDLQILFSLICYNFFHSYTVY